jgi:hypothetical protein
MRTGVGNLVTGLRRSLPLGAVGARPVEHEACDALARLEPGAG